MSLILGVGGLVFLLLVVGLASVAGDAAVFLVDFFRRRGAFLGVFDFCLPLQSLAPFLLVEPEARDAVSIVDPDPEDRERRRGEPGTLRIILSFLNVCLPLQSLAPFFLVEPEVGDAVLVVDLDLADRQRRRGDLEKLRMSLGFFDGVSLALQSSYASVLLEPEEEDPDPDSVDRERRRGGLG